MSLFDRLFSIPFEFPPLIENEPKQQTQSQIGILTPSDIDLTEAFAAAVKEAVAQHWAAGRAVPTMADNKVVWVEPPNKYYNPDGVSSRDACQACWEAGANPGWQYEEHTCGKPTLRKPQRGDQIGPFRPMYEDD